MCFLPVRELCLLLTDFFKRSVIPQFFFFLRKLKLKAVQMLQLEEQ